MNATPMSINAVNAAVPSPAAGKQDAMPPEVPFSQVLSSEMAQNRRDSHAAKEGAEAAADADAEATSPAGRPADDAANAGAAVVDSAESPADPLALPLADNPAAARDPLIALGIPSYPLKPAPATPGEAVVEDAPAQAASALPLQDARKDKAPLAAQAETAGQAIDTPRGASKADPALLSGRVEGNADKTAAATAFAGQLAAARQAEAVKTREFVSELVSNPALRPTVQAPLPPLPAGSDIAAPHLSPAVGTPAWNQALGDKIVWMAAGAQQSATLTLNPPNLGPLQVVLNVTNEQATASFFSAQPEVRQALEAAFPRLREMMNEAGIQLGQASVSADTPQQNNTPDRQPQRIAAPFPGADESAAGGVQALHAPAQTAGRGLVDTFA
jgi:flagellar hook-length control protein FliK